MRLASLEDAYRAHDIRLQNLGVEPERDPLRSDRPFEELVQTPHNHARQIWAADLFVVPTVTFRLLFVRVILGHDCRWIVHAAVTRHHGGVDLPLLP